MSQTRRLRPAERLSRERDRVVSDPGQLSARDSRILSIVNDVSVAVVMQLMLRFGAPRGVGDQAGKRHH